MKLEILIGMIASGKSTYAARRAKEGAIVICHDDLTVMLHAEYRYEQGLRQAYRTAEEMLAHTFLHHGRDVVIDRTHLTAESRRRWVDFRMSHYHPGLRLGAIVFPIEAADEHAYRRFNSDPRGRPYTEWLKVACHHAGQAEAEPLDAKAEGFDFELLIAEEVPA